MPRAVVAITGASGARYGVRLVEQLSLAGWEIDLIVSKAGEINLKLECGIGASELNEIEGVSIHNNANVVFPPPVTTLAIPFMSKLHEASALDCHFLGLKSKVISIDIPL